jgi:hypothetical protein
LGDADGRRGDGRVRVGAPDASIYRKFSIASTYKALKKTLEISVLILFLVAASNFFGAVFSRLGTPGDDHRLVAGCLDLSAKHGHHPDPGAWFSFSDGRWNGCRSC